MHAVSKNRRTIWIIVALLGAIGMIYAQGTARMDLGPYLAPGLWCACGLIACLGIMMSSFTKRLDPIPLSAPWRSIIFLLTAAALLFLTAQSSMHVAALFEKFPVSIKDADIIPSIQIFVQRFLGGEEVYRPIDYGSYTSIPTYLPFTWLPFIPAEVLNFDYRWISFGAIISMLTLYTVKYFQKNGSTIYWLMTSVLLFATIHQLSLADEGNMRFAVEFLPAAFYMLFCFTLANKNPWMTLIGIIPCILSRYSFVIWVPFFLIICYFYKDKKYFLKLLVGIAAGVLLLYIIPFIQLDFHKIFDGLKFYAKNAPSKWVAFGWQPEGSQPYHLKQGYGLALFFYDGFKDNIPDGISLIKKVQLIGCFLLSAGTTILYLKNRRSIIRLKPFLTASLGAYLIIFYSFLYAPYGYLFFVPTFVVMAGIWQMLYDDGGSTQLDVANGN